MHNTALIQQRPGTAGASACGTLLQEEPEAFKALECNHRGTGSQVRTAPASAGVATCSAVQLKSARAYCVKVL